MGNSFLQFRIVRFHNNYGLFYDVEYLHHYGPFKLFSRWKPINREAQKIFGAIKFFDWPDDTYGFATKEAAEAAIQKMVAHINNEDTLPIYYTYVLRKENDN